MTLWKGVSNGKNQKTDQEFQHLLKAELNLLDNIPTPQFAQYFLE